MPRRWLVFVHQMPAHPSNGRVKIWRRLQGVGAIALKNALHVLPDSAQALEDFEWLRSEVVALGGEASIFNVSSMSASDERYILSQRKEKAMQQAALRVREAAQLGFRRCVVPEANAAIEDVPGGLSVVGVRTAADALETLL